MKGKKAGRQASPQKPRFDDIDVQRINVVEKDGRVRLVIAKSEQQAVTVVGGKQILPNRKREAGLIFFNDEGVLVSRQRMFVGKDTAGTAKLVLSDGNAKPRLVLSVDRDGAAKIEFLDSDGKVVRSVVP